MADHMRKKKKRGRSNLFRSCFRSFAVDERPLLNDKSDSGKTDDGRLGKPVLVAESVREGDDVIPDAKSVNATVAGTGVDCSDERSSHGRTVSRLLKAVWFDSVMVKYCSSSKSSIASDTSDSFLPIEKTCKQSDDSNACINESTDMEDSSSRCSNLFSSSSRATSSSYSSSSSSSANSNSRWLSDQKTSSQLDTADSNHPISSNSQKPNLINSNSRSCYDQKSSSQTDSISLPLSKSNTLHKKQLSQFDSRNAISSNPDKIKSSGNNLNIRWCVFLLLSLIVLVVYGRIYAIVCTSIWFYLMPCQRVKRVNSVTDSAKVMDTESEQYRKRVIMAGLLDRTRNPLR